MTANAVATTAIVAARVTIFFSLAFTFPPMFCPAQPEGLDEANVEPRLFERVVMTELVRPCTRISAQSDGEAPSWRLLRHCAIDPSGAGV